MKWLVGIAVCYVAVALAAADKDREKEKVGCISCIAERDASTDVNSETLNVSTVHDKATHVFTTKGKLSTKIPVATLATITSNVNTYNEWALTDINKDFKERGLLVLIKSLRTQDNQKKLFADYDLNLPWPFNFKDMSLEMVEMKREVGADGQLKSLRYGLPKASLTMNRFELDLGVADEKGMGALEFDFKVEIASLLSPFLSRERYVKNVQGRIVQIMKNLEAHTQAMAKPQ